MTWGNEVPSDDVLLHRYREAEKTRAAVAAQPPVPVPLVNAYEQQVWTPLIVHHAEWRQWSGVEDQVSVARQQQRREGTMITEASVAREIAAVDNPLRSLAAALLDAADGLDAAGLIPLGVTLSTRHRGAPREPYGDGRTFAVVSVSTTTVRRADVQRVIGEDREEGMATGADS